MILSPFQETNIDHKDLEYLKEKYKAEAIMIVLGIGNKSYFRGINYDGKRVGFTQVMDNDEEDDEEL